MKITAVNTQPYISRNFRLEKQIKPDAKVAENIKSSYTSENIRANFAPLSFKGNIPEIRSAFIITKDEADIPLMQTKLNGSYVVDFDSQTEVIYGVGSPGFGSSGFCVFVMVNPSASLPTASPLL